MRGGFFFTIVLTKVHLVNFEVNFNFIEQTDPRMFQEYYAGVLRNERLTNANVPANLRGIILPFLEINVQQAKSITGQSALKEPSYGSRAHWVTGEEYLQKVCFLNFS